MFMKNPGKLLTLCLMKMLTVSIGNWVIRRKSAVKNPVLRYSTTRQMMHMLASEEKTPANAEKGIWFSKRWINLPTFLEAKTVPTMAIAYKRIRSI